MSAAQTTSDKKPTEVIKTIEFKHPDTYDGLPNKADFSINCFRFKPRFICLNDDQFGLFGGTVFMAHLSFTIIALCWTFGYFFEWTHFHQIFSLFLSRFFRMSASTKPIEQREIGVLSNKKLHSGKAGSFLNLQKLPPNWLFYLLAFWAESLLLEEGV